MKPARTRRQPTPREFFLGPPGSTIRITYPLQTRSDRLGAIVGSIVFGAATIASAFAPRVGWVAIVFGVLALLAATGLRKRSGQLVLEADHLEVTNGSRTTRASLGDVAGTSLFTSSGMVSEPRVQWIAQCTGPTPVLVALLEPRDADELSVRIGLRQRALRLGSASLATALETLHLAGAEALGVTESGGEWRPFFSAKDLVAQASPYRGGARLPACVRADVWAAAQSLESDLASRVDIVALT